MPAVPPWFRLVSWLMAGLLGVCVALQYNDPDPARWMAIYGAGAVISLLLPGTQPVAALALVVGLGAAAWSLYLANTVWGVIALSDLTSKMNEQGGAVEAGREAGGLALEAVWLLAAGAFRGTRA